MKEHLLIFWQRKLEDAYRENYELQADNNRLKAENDRLKASPFADKKLAVAYGSQEHLEAEVARLKEQYNGIIDTQLEEIARLKAEVERLTEALNKFTNTPNGVHGVEVKVSFWSKSGCRLPSSFSTFWMNAEKGQP